MLMDLLESRQEVEGQRNQVGNTAVDGIMAMVKVMGVNGRCQNSGRGGGQLGLGKKLQSDEKILKCEECHYN
jgi:hypothetical protein